MHVGKLQNLLISTLASPKPMRNFSSHPTVCCSAQSVHYLWFKSTDFSQVSQFHKEKAKKLLRALLKRSILTLFSLAPSLFLKLWGCLASDISSVIFQRAFVVALNFKWDWEPFLFKSLHHLLLLSPGVKGKSVVPNRSIKFKSSIEIFQTGPCLSSVRFQRGNVIWSLVWWIRSWQVKLIENELKFSC